MQHNIICIYIFCGNMCIFAVQYNARWRDLY
nr:MAG TPA: hypothetical protein [Caudoviricetes sp.]